jgi:hypothetical protein
MPVMVPESGECVMNPPNIVIYVWQLGYCPEQKCKVFYDLNKNARSSKIEYRKVLESQLMLIKG